MSGEAAVESYLARLGFTERPPATLDRLRVLHRAHVARIPYDNLSVVLGRPDPVDAQSCMARAAGGGRLGDGFHQNTAFEHLLTQLGFTVTRRRGHAWRLPEEQLGHDFNHLALVVSGLETGDNEFGHWWVDVGLGEGFTEPLPLLRGEHVVDGWSYEIGAGFGLMLPTGPPAWTFRTAPGGSFTGLVVTSGNSGADAVQSAPDHLSRSAGSRDGHALVVQRLDGSTKHTLRGCVVTTRTPNSTEQHEIESYDAWRAALNTVGLPVEDVSEPEWRDLWARTLAAHRARPDSEPRGR